MRKGLLLLLLVFFLAVPVSGAEFTAPEAPDSARQFLPDETESFGEGLWYVISSALKEIHPSFMDALKTCVSLIAAALTIGLVSDICPDVKKVVSLIGTVSAGVILFQPLHTFIRLGVQTITEISQYGKLLLPVMTAALAAQGAVTQSGSVYMATAFVDALLTTAISDLLVPMVYIYLCVSVGCNLWEQPLLQQIRKFLKWTVTWGGKSKLIQKLVAKQMPVLQIDGTDIFDVNEKHLERIPRSDPSFYFVEETVAVVQFRQGVHALTLALEG